VVTNGIVTPEAVVLEFETASVGSRLIAYTIDSLIQTALAIAFFVAAALASDALGSLGWLGAALIYIAVFLILLGYAPLFETFWRGRTPGKAALGLRVVTSEGAPVRFRHAAIRGALGLVDFWLLTGGVAVLAILLTRRNQRLGDLVAGTLVLRERTGARSLKPVQFSVPHGLEAYAASIDPAGLRAADYAAVRSFLLRAASLTPAMRDPLARDLAAPLAARLHHQPPAGVPAEAFLRCVAARYQERSAAASAHRAAVMPDVWADTDRWRQRERPGLPADEAPAAADAGSGFIAPS
jgi:uncharacterized RDD family membrane protein YckC